MKIALATANKGKIKEIEAVLDMPGLEWLTVYDVADWPAIEETGATFQENARLKALGVARHFNLPALADDSGLEVDALGGLPGVRSARFAGPSATDAENVAKLIADLREFVGGAAVPAPTYTARFVCELALAWPAGKTVTAAGVCEGEIILTPRGSGGFGYDPIFVPAGYDRTTAELSAAEKNKISHRGRALRALKDRLAGELRMDGPPNV
jgi:XTP/dITP diphosphohydrolase